MALISHTPPTISINVTATNTPINLLFITILYQHVWRKIKIVLLILGAFVIGSLWTKVQYLEKKNQPPLPTNNVAQAPSDNGAPIKVSVDDDPVLGDKMRR